MVGWNTRYFYARLFASAHKNTMLSCAVSSMEFLLPTRKKTKRLQAPKVQPVRNKKDPGNGWGAGIEFDGGEPLCHCVCVEQAEKLFGKIWFEC